MAERTFAAVLHKEGNPFVAECPEVGTVSQGHSLEDAVTNLKEATELYLQEFPAPANTRVFVTTFKATYGRAEANSSGKPAEFLNRRGRIAEQY